MRKIGCLLCCFLSMAAWAQPTLYHKIIQVHEGGKTACNDILLDDNGVMYWATDDGVYQYNGRNATQLKAHAKTKINLLGQGKKQVIAVQQNGIFSACKSNALQSVDSLPVDFVVSQYLSFPLPLIATAGNGLMIKSGKQWIKCAWPGIEMPEYIHQIITIAPQQYVVATDEGFYLVQFKNDTWHTQHFQMKQGLPDNIVLSLAAQNHQLYLGTYSGGVACYSPENTIYTLPQTQAYGAIQSMTVTAHFIWAGTADGYLLKIKDTTLVASYDLKAGAIKKILDDGNGQIWCAATSGVVQTSGEALSGWPGPKDYVLDKVTYLHSFQWEQKEYVALALQNNLWISPLQQKPEWQLVAITESAISAIHFQQNYLWLGTMHSGLLQWTFQQKAKAINHNDANENILFITGKNTKLWVSNMEGASAYSINENGVPEKQTAFGRKDGLRNDYVYEIVQAKDGATYFATDGSGIMKLDAAGKNFTEQGLQDKAVYSIAKSDSIIYALTDEGIFLKQKDVWSSMKINTNWQDGEYNEVLATKNWVAFEQQQGVWIRQNNKGAEKVIDKNLYPSLDSFTNALHGIAKNGDDIILVPAKNEILLINNGLPQRATQLLLMNVRLFFKEEVMGQHRFDATQNQLSFSFEVFNYQAGITPLFRYQLKGLNNDWIYIGDQTVSFPNLRAGKYELIFQSSYNDAFDSASEVRYAFSIDKPFYFKWSFLLLCAVCIGALIYAIMKMREQQLQHINALQKERLHFEYEHLRSQVQPHFLFNSLNTLTALIEEEPEKALQYTVQLSDLYRSIISHAGKNTITLKEEWEIVQHYLFIQQTRFGKGLQVENKMKQDDMQDKVVPLALQMLLENAIKHNVIQEKQPLHISIETNEKYLMVRNKMQLKLSKEKSTGFGLSSIEKRYAQLSNAKVIYGRQGDYFIVKLPLL